MVKQPTDADYAVSGLLNGLESGLKFPEVAEIYFSSHCGVSFDNSITDAIKAKQVINSD